MFRGDFIDLILGHSPFKGTPRTRRRQMAMGFLVVLVLVLGLISLRTGAWAAHQPQEATDPRWIAATGSQVAQMRQWWVMKLSALTVLEAYLTMSLLYRTPLGKMLWWWSDVHDTAESQGAKTSGASLAFCALLIGFALLNAQVLP